MTPAQKADQTRTKRLADQVRFDLFNLANNGGTEADVVRVFSELKASPHRKADVFWMLDNVWRTPGHSLLRRTRNHPEHGRQLFALFR